MKNLVLTLALIMILALAGNAQVDIVDVNIGIRIGKTPDVVIVDDRPQRQVPVYRHPPVCQRGRGHKHGHHKKHKRCHKHMQHRYHQRFDD